MKRCVMTAVAAGLLLASAQVALAQDTVTYIDPTTKKEVDTTGTIVDETPVGIKIKPKTGEPKLIPALDVVWVTYKDPRIDNFEFRQPFGKERLAMVPLTRPEKRNDHLNEALSGYRSLATKVRSVPFASRYVQYKIAQVQAMMAREDPNNPTKITNPAKGKSAIDALVAYQAVYATGWEIIPCLKLLAELQEEAGNLDGARKAYEDLTLVPGAPADIKESSDLLIAQMLMRGRRYPDAEKKIQGLYKAAGTDNPQRAFLQVFLSQSQILQRKTEGVEQQLRSAISSSTDLNLRATAYNLLGDYYQLKSQDEDAFWEYLRVDSLYSQDKNEHAKALYYLAKLFNKVKNDPIRGEQYLERLTTDKIYTGAEFQRKALAEKK